MARRDGLARAACAAASTFRVFVRCQTGNECCCLFKEGLFQSPPTTHASTGPPPRWKYLCVTMIHACPRDPRSGGLLLLLSRTRGVTLPELGSLLTSSPLPTAGVYAVSSVAPPAALIFFSAYRGSKGKDGWMGRVGDARAIEPHTARPKPKAPPHIYKLIRHSYKLIRHSRPWRSTWP